MNSTNTSTLLSRIGLLLGPVKKRALSSSVILVFQGITEGVGLLLILPLLSIAGFDNISKSSSAISAFINRFFDYTNIPLSLLSVLIIYLLTIGFYAVLKYFQNINTAIISQQIAIKWRFHLFKLITNSSWSQIQFFKTSTLQEILTMEVRKLGSIGTQLVQLLSAFIIILIYFSLSLLLSIKLTALAIIPIGILLLLNKPLNRKSYSLGEGLIQNNQSLYKIIEEHLAAIKLVKTYNKENQQSETFEEISAEVEMQQVKFVKTNNRTRLTFELIAALAIVVYVYFALSYKIVPVGELLLLLFIFVRLFPKVGNMVGSYQSILNTIPSFESVLDSIELLKEETSIKNSSSTNIDYKDQIHFEGVHFSYSDKEVLTNLSFSIPYQKTTALIGHSGAGKSTIVDLILGLQSPLKGEIKIGKHLLSAINLVNWRNQVAYVPQDSFLFNGSIKENLLWVKPDATNEQLWDALKQASAADFIRNLPDQMDTIAGNRGTQLSGGERQRIALTRALLKKPKLLILDEATSAVDDINENLIKDALSHLSGKMTIIIVAHRSKLVDLADEIIKL